MKRIGIKSLFIFFGCLILFTGNAEAMHISEGILPLEWAGLWYLVALPFLITSFWAIKRKLRKEPSFKTFLGLMGAMVFIISCMPVPVPTAGTCSHPCGTGISAILIGPLASIFVTSIALLIQALFMAHGGITTWGADLVSMGVVGSCAGYLTFKTLRKIHLPLFLCGFFAGLLADWATYATTSFELASALHGTQSLSLLFKTVLIAFIPTQLPLGLLEGFLTGGMVVFVAGRRPDILRALKVIEIDKDAVIKKGISAIVFFLILSFCSPVYAGEDKWRGVDEKVVERFAQEHGRAARKPFINTDQGDLLLFVFLLAGAGGGFVLGYCWRKLFQEKKD